MQRFWRSFRRNKIALLGLIIVVLMSFGALFAPIIAPLAIMITVLGFNFLGDGLRDALDPTQYK